jgi:hypothetical protein
MVTGAALAECEESGEVFVELLERVWEGVDGGDGFESR